VELSALVIFALALLVAAGSPGPSIAALVARVLVRGWHEVAPFVAAMWIGEAIWLTTAAVGLAALAETFHWAFIVVKYCGVIYLLDLAWHMWHASAEGAESKAPATAARCACSLPDWR
jgi:threonine/homoserine/homoserine lactone efflux protein